ncbi:hypothetical protein PCE1_002569 [Barthelona sp. PCE]
MFSLKVFASAAGILNVLAFLTMGYDKNQAKKNEGHRISELTLHTYLYLLGGIGIVCGMFVFRHKTQKVTFKQWNFALISYIIFIIALYLDYYIMTLCMFAFGLCNVLYFASSRKLLSMILYIPLLIILSVVGVIFSI